MGYYSAVKENVFIQHELQKHYAEQKKLDTKEHTDSLYVKFF